MNDKPNYLPPTLPAAMRPNNSNERLPVSLNDADSAVSPSVVQRGTDREPFADDIVLRLPRSTEWAHTIVRLVAFLLTTDRVGAELERDGDKLYVDDVMYLARKLLRSAFHNGGIPEAEILLASMTTEEALSVLHRAQCDEEHGPDGNCRWRRNLARGHFALL